MDEGRLDGQPRDDPRPRAANALDHELAPERLHPISETVEAGAEGRLGATDAVVENLNREEPAFRSDTNARARRARVLGHVRERLGADEIGGSFDCRGRCAD